MVRKGKNQAESADFHSFFRFRFLKLPYRNEGKREKSEIHSIFHARCL